MKIGFVYDVLYPDTIGGVEKRIHEIGVRLVGEGHEVHLFTMKFWEGEDTIRRDGMVLHGVCRPMELYIKGRRSVMQALWYAVNLVPILLRTEVELIDCQNFPYFPVLSVWLVSRIKGTMFFVTWHEYWGSYWYKYLGFFGLFGKVIETLALIATPKLVSVSPLTTERLKLAGYNPEVVEVPNGIDLGEIDSVLPCGPLVDIIFIGRFIPEKHPEIVVETIARLVIDRPEISCIMIGDGPMMPHLKNLIQKKSVQGNVFLTGFIADHRSVLAQMKRGKVFVFPSEREGFGIAAVEALASGLFLVTADHPGNAARYHVIEGNGAAVPLDPDLIANKITEFLLKEPDCQALREYAGRFDWGYIIRESYQKWIRLSEE